MNSTNQRSTAVTASGAIAILGSALTALGVLLGTVGVLVVPPPRARVPGILPIVVVMMAAFFAIAVWGLVSGIGLLRFRNWARISVLVWSGITTPITLLIIVVFLFMPMPVPPGSPVTTATFARVFAILFYGVPLGIAIWWLILFTRAHIVAQFKSAQLMLPAAISIEGDPALGANATVPPPMPAPDLPIPIIVLACFFLLCSLSFVMVFLMHMPAMLFGVRIGGTAGATVYVLWCLLYVSSGVGILKRAVWSYSVAIGLQILGLISGVVTALSPNFDSVMRRVLSDANLPPPDASTFPGMAHLRGFTLVSLIFPLIILGMLVYYRPRFLEAAARLAAPNTTPTQQF